MTHRTNTQEINPLVELSKQMQSQFPGSGFIWFDAITREPFVGVHVEHADTLRKRGYNFEIRDGMCRVWCSLPENMW